uniref:PLD nuclease N-terminal domain-containing protein n=1 Tax=Globicatella sulfidifaciens TaxID=136093 RepID=UPI0023F4E9AA|nr:PLD nuclease N-terminal domain-containing protein [Globicatella sulfidifaciens]
MGQITWFILFLIKLTRYSVIISAIFSLLSLIMVLHIVVKDDNPSYKIAWIILIMALPLFGELFYLFFGSKRPSKGMRILLDKEHQKVISMLEINDEILEEIGAQDHRLMGTFKYLQEKISPI